MKREKPEVEWAGEGDPPGGGLFAWDPSIPKVRHRGHTYPQRFRWTWTRTDGLEVELDVEVDSENGPAPVAVSIRKPGGLSSADYRPPIASMVRQAAAAYAAPTEDRDHGVEVRPPRLGERVPMGRMTGQTDDERLERVAELYEQALTEGLRVTELITKEENVSDKTAYGLISKARKAGLLPPTRPGRKAGS